MSSRLITLFDIYFFEKSDPIDPEMFTDIIGRNFREPARGPGIRRLAGGAHVAHDDLAE